MGFAAPARVTAVLGPTNTGKTHLAVERLCAHSSGMIGFPLRLLAREVYDRVVAIKGPDEVALITGEEKIVPARARYFLCTAESMPLDREVGFLALDEAQMGADAERGHVFTDRLLRARGRDETMILGSETLRPLIRQLLPEAEIIGRPRFSTLSYVAPRKIGRLPKRSAIVAFTAEDVYAIAEMLRRHKGGAAVVMGALSPRTRNAQVALYQSGEVDYLVATDAIGMGLNMDIAHVGFAALGKFDGRRRRRLTLSELGQIAGRAGRHQKDGTFGVVHFSADDKHQLDAEEVLAVEGHEFPPLTELKWRNATLDFSSVAGLIASLEQRPDRAGLARTDETIDLAVLRLLASEPDIAERARERMLLKRLWATCQLPDYRKTAALEHARLVGRVFRHLSEARMTLPTDWIAAELARLDNIQGDIDTLAARIAGVRTWTYAAHQADWLDDPVHWAERTRALEDKLSDALHEKLTQRFVDRRTAVLMRGLAQRSDEAIKVATSGEVVVEGTAIGTLAGFHFSVDPATRHAEKRRVMAAAERVLASEMGRRARALEAADADDVALVWAGAHPPTLAWNGQRVAALAAGRTALEPKVVLEAGAERLAHADRGRVQDRLHQWVRGQIEQHLKPLLRLSDAASRPADKGGLSGPGRGLVVQLIDHAGCLRRADVDSLIKALTADDRKLLRQAGVRLGMMHIFVPSLLKPEPSRWRLTLWSLKRPKAPVVLVPDGRVSIPSDRAIPGSAYTAAGYWRVGAKAVRLDMVERLADALRDQAKAQARTRSPFVPPADLISMVGLNREEFAGLMGALGYRQRCLPEIRPLEAPEPEPETAAPLPAAAPIIAFQWKGRADRTQTPRPDAAPVRASSPFAALAILKER
jgi:ATP-dependent RNA helicase SUPV3L1/SUV3